MTSDYITNKRAGIEHEVLILEERRGRNEHESDEARLEELGRELEELEIEEALIPFRDAASAYSAACNKHRLWSTEITYQEQRQAKDKLLGMIADVLRERAATLPLPSQPQEVAWNEPKELRDEFEEWYVRNVFDLQAAPIGSRDCDLQWRAYKARAMREQPQVSEAGEAQRIIRAIKELDSIRSPSYDGDIAIHLKRPGCGETTCYADDLYTALSHAADKLEQWDTALRQAGKGEEA